MNNCIKVLSKSEMKIIIGGEKRIYCRIDGKQEDYSMFSNLAEAAHACYVIAISGETTCGGCAEFSDDMDRIE